MATRTRKINDRDMDVQVLIRDLCPEIDLDGSELLKLEYVRTGTRILCIRGTLWLTQPGDPHDHLLQTGQSFALDHEGTVLVQGLPRGKALIREAVDDTLTNNRDCSNQWDYQLRAEHLP